MCVCPTLLNEPNFLSKSAQQIVRTTNFNYHRQGYTRNDVYALRFAPRVDGDFFDEDPLEMLKTAPIKPTMIGINEVEMLVYGEEFSENFCLSINLKD